MASGSRKGEQNARSKDRGEGEERVSARVPLIVSTGGHVPLMTSPSIQLLGSVLTRQGPEPQLEGCSENSNPIPAPRELPTTGQTPTRTPPAVIREHGQAGSRHGPVMCSEPRQRFR